MRVQRFLFKSLSVVVVTSLLLTYAPVQAASARETRSAFNAPDTLSALPFLLQKEASNVTRCSTLAVLPAWWLAADEEGELRDRLSTVTGGRPAELALAGSSSLAWLYVADVYDYTTDSSNGHEWIGTASNLVGPPDGVKFGADSGPYQGSNDWVYLDLGTSVPTGTEGCWLGWESSWYALYNKQVWDGQQWRDLPSGHGLDCTQFPGGNDSRGFHSDWSFRYARFQALMNMSTNGYWRLDALVVEVPDDLEALADDADLAPCECPFGCSTQRTNWVGGPINTRSGNYHYGRQDLSIPALGGPLRFEQSYNSLVTNLYTTPLGYGWTHNYAVGLVFSGTVGGEPNTVVVEGCRGSRFRFEDNGDGTYAPFPGVWATLTRTLAWPYTYTLTGVDQSAYVFDDAGRLAEIRDPQDQAIRLIYSGGQLARVEDGTGERYLAFGYDDGRLVEVRDPISRTVQYGYDGAGNLVAVTGTRGLAWTYTYTSAHLLYEVRDPLGRIVERTEYDGQGRAVRQWDGTLGQPLQIHYGVDGTAIITDPLGRVTMDWYDARGLLAWQDDGHNSSYRAYDDDFNWTKVTDGNDHVTRYTFDEMGLPEVVTDALSHVTRMTYDDLDHLTAVTDALGHTTRYEYEGNLLTTATDALNGMIANTYDERGLLIQVVDHGLTTTYGYDQFGQRVAVTDTLGHVTTYGYDAAGRLVRITNHESRITLQEYDDGDNLIRVTRNYLPGYPQNWHETYNLVTEYDPATGRFLTRDPFPGLVGLPQTQHSYVYVGNNPVNLTDPSGEFAFIPLLLVGTAGGALGGLGYYAIRTALNPCVDWNWEEAIFWGGVGTGIGAILGSGIYGGLVSRLDGGGRRRGASGVQWGSVR